MRINESAKGELRGKKKGQGGGGGGGGVILGFVARLQLQEQGKEFLCEKRTAKNDHMDLSRVRVCLLILCFLSYLMKY